MAVQLRPYQEQLVNGIREAWSMGHKNVLAVMPCRSGKTITFASMNTDNRPSCAVVHRQELVGQISSTYARVGIEHRIIAPQPVINYCIQRQIKEAGRSFYHPNAPATVAGVDTLIRRHEKGDKWSRSVDRWTGDECHHFLNGNKWGTAADMFENALGLGVTATAIRADRRSLHREQGGVFDYLVQGIDMTALQEMGNVCKYRVIAGKSSIDEAILRIGTTGEFTEDSKKKATEGSEIVGDVVRTYMEKVNGKNAIAYCVDVKQAEDLAERFRQAGVSAAALDGKTPDAVRQATVDKFVAGEIKVLTNCDLFSEGLDLPGVDVVIMARPTNSFGLFVQQFCRCLTPSPGKEYGIIIDHVGNVLRMAATFGMPDTPRKWQLWQEEGARRKKEPDAIPHRACEVCTLTYEATTMQCPFCGHIRVPEDRGAPKEVDGILSEMSPELLQQLRMAQAQAVAEPGVRPGASDAERGRAHKIHMQRIMAHNSLRDAMELWGGVQLAAGFSDTQMQARFYHRFGVDVMTAATLKPEAAIGLAEEIRKSLT